MTKRNNLRLNSLFCTNSCTFLKSVKKWCTKCENDKTWWFRAENFCFIQTRALYLKLLKSGVPLAKMGVISGKMPKCVDLGLKTCVLYKLVHFAGNRWKVVSACENDKTCWSRAENADLQKVVYFAEIAKKCCAQWGYNKTCWSRAEIAVLDKLVHFAKNA